MIRSVIFDFDGTLVDSNAIKHDCFFEVARHLPESEKHLTEILADPSAGDRHGVFSQLALRYKGPTGEAPNAETMAQRYTEMCEMRVTAAPDMKGTQRVLQTLQTDGFHLAISSATPQETLQRIVAARGLSDFFANVLGKPQEKTAHIEHVMRQLHVDARDLAYVGDSEIDQHSALASGCHFIGVGKTAGRFHSRPQFMADELPEILPMLAHISAVSDL